MKNALILLAGGVGKRTGLKIPKQFVEIGSTNLIEYFLTNLEEKIFDIIIITAKKDDISYYIKPIIKKFKAHNIKSALSGKTRQLSVKNSLKILKKFNPKNVLIHDSARPLTSNKLIKKIIKNITNEISCVPFITHNDLIKIKNNKSLQKNKILNIQTPQGFNFKKILLAHDKSKKDNAADDSTLIEDINLKLKMIRGEISNFKITTNEDLKFFDRIRTKNFRSGIGYDIHKIDFKSKIKKLVLCGVRISHSPLIGHSDADVGYHAVCDSILGSLSLKDIGHYFNDKNPKWKNANSKIFIIFCKNELKKKKYKIINLDINFICETPNIKKINHLMKNNLSKLLNISNEIISIKATTNEKISLIGNGEGIAAESIVQISNE